MKCVICGIEINSIEEAIDQGWILYFYEAEIECGPACPECSGTLLQMGKDGEMELKEQYEGKPLDAFREKSLEWDLIYSVKDLDIQIHQSL